MTNELLERVKAETGPNPRLDESIGLALGWVKQETKGGGWYWKGPFLDGEDMPPFTASVDAALALVQRCLPDAHWAIDAAGLERPEAHINAIVSDGATAPLAILAALLSALPAPPEKPHDE